MILVGSVPSFDTSETSLLAGSVGWTISRNALASSGLPVQGREVWRERGKEKREREVGEKVDFKI